MKLLLLILISILTCSCNKNDDLVAPPITQENTFSCKIDGELFVAKDYFAFLGSGNGISVVLTPPKRKNWQITLSDGKNDIYIHIANIDQTGRIKISKSDGDKFFFYETNNVMELERNQDEYEDIMYISHNDSGYISILEIEKAKVLILEFEELKLYSIDDPTKMLTLTDGKLNINLETLNKD